MVWVPAGPLHAARPSGQPSTHAIQSKLFFHSHAAACVHVLQLELERKLRALLTKEKEKAEEEAALAMGLCTGGAMLP